MVRLRIIAVGKDKDRWVSDGIAHYTKLLKRFAKVEIKIAPSPKSTASSLPASLMKEEARRLIKVLDTKNVSGSPTVALADTGRNMDTMAFSKWLEKTTSRVGTINFIIGGAYGLEDTILNRADHVISLSPLTFSHQLVRLVLLEQLYRALSITHGTDYHK